MSLCLTRREGQRIFLTGGITIEVVGIENIQLARPRVRLLISAPPDVEIAREEVAHKGFGRLAADNAAAGGRR